MDISKLKTDAKSAVGGAWIGGIDGFEDFRVRTKSINCPQAERYASELYIQILGRRVRRKDKTVPPEVSNYVTAKTLIDVCVLDWENWQEAKKDGNGAPVMENGQPVMVDVPYSRAQLAAALLADAPLGIEITTSKGRVEYKRTPDKKSFNFEMKRFLDGLVDAALRVDAPDDDDEEDGADVEDGENAEKNSSRPGSAGDTASAAQ